MTQQLRGRTLREHYGAQRVSPPLTDEDIFQAGTEFFSRFEVYHGHLTTRCLPLLPDGMMRCVFLRKPGAHALSMYNLLRGLKGEVHYHDMDEETRRLIDLSLDLSFMDFFRSGDSGITSFIRNPQVRALQENKPTDPTGGFHGPESLERAMTNLAQMDLIGLLEEYSKSLDLFSSMIEHALPRPENLNASPERRNLTAEETDVIGWENHLDMALYRHAYALFDSRLMRQ